MKCNVLTLQDTCVQSKKRDPPIFPHVSFCFFALNALGNARVRTHSINTSFLLPALLTCVFRLS